eukprot:gnl/Spiro4/4884_TR2430_c0_g1_i1.p1 gnl/Spiro4/4884_TR2430_c0_g1~~gnl/Spiro4/4884_TR2430_c0_g1_i1.p1  ORF type:complete len:528 (+),score=104.20 gnl/Spiro4/4884_TR2430_c0_g1_i1:81-1664(+)
MAKNFAALLVSLSVAVIIAVCSAATTTPPGSSTKRHLSSNERKSEEAKSYYESIGARLVDKIVSPHSAASGGQEASDEEEEDDSDHSGDHNKQKQPALHHHLVFHQLPVARSSDTTRLLHKTFRLFEAPLLAAKLNDTVFRGDADLDWWEDLWKVRPPPYQESALQKQLYCARALKYMILGRNITSLPLKRVELVNMRDGVVPPNHPLFVPRNLADAQFNVLNAKGQPLVHLFEFSLEDHGYEADYLAYWKPQREAHNKFLSDFPQWGYAKLAWEAANDNYLRMNHYKPHHMRAKRDPVTALFQKWQSLPLSARPTRHEPQPPRPQAVAYDLSVRFVATKVGSEVTTWWKPTGPDSDPTVLRVQRIEDFLQLASALKNAKNLQQQFRAYLDMVGSGGLRLETELMDRFLLEWDPEKKLAESKKVVESYEQQLRESIPFASKNVHEREEVTFQQKTDAESSARELLAKKLHFAREQLNADFPLVERRAMGPRLFRLYVNVWAVSQRFAMAHLREVWDTVSSSTPADEL